MERPDIEAASGAQDNVGKYDISLRLLVRRLCAAATPTNGDSEDIATVAREIHSSLASKDARIVELERRVAELEQRMQKGTR